MSVSEMIGRRLGEYEIVAELGRGASARVFQARDTRDGRDVAIKIINNDAEDRQDFGRRFEFEIEAVRKLHHPNIVAVYGAGETEELVYLVMQCVRGGTLREQMRERRDEQHPFEVAQAVAYAVQMAQALHHAHRQGIVHRDVKPSNMLLADADATHLLLTDFGIAKIQGLRGITKSGAMMGTPEYMSPEQAQGRESDPRSDIYSLGCVLYELLAGRPPFQALKPVSVLYQQVHKRPEDIRDYNEAVPPELARIIETALAKNPDDRFPTAEHFARALAPFTQPGYQGNAVEEPDDDLLPDDLLPDDLLPDDLSADDTLPPFAVSPSWAGRASPQSAPHGPFPLELGSDPTADLIARAKTLPPPPHATSGPASRRTHGPVKRPLDEGLSDLIDPDVQQALLESEHLERLDNPSRPTSGPRRAPSKTDPLRRLTLPARPAGSTSAPLHRYTNAPLLSGEMERLEALRATQGPQPQARLAPQVQALPVEKVTTLKPARTGEEAVRWPQLSGVGADATADAASRTSMRRRRRRPVMAALLSVALLALLAGGTLALGGTGLIALPIPGLGAHAAPASSPTLAPTTTPLPTATATTAPATPIPQALADQRAASSLRAATLSPANNSTCDAATTSATFTSGKTIWIYFCTSGTVAANSVTVTLRQSGETVCTMPGVTANNAYVCYATYTLSPGHYDMLVTMRIGGTTGTARDLPFTVS